MANPARATLADLADLGVASQRIATVADAKKQKRLNAVSDWLDGYLQAQATLPLTAPYPQDVIDCEANVAAYRLLCNIGFNPMAPADIALKEEAARWVAWAEGVSKGEITPPWVDEIDDPSGPDVITSTSRGYSERGIGYNSAPCARSGPFSDD